jgi:ABC-type Fe3+-hydroxamate transport system substrate-binding protein
MATAILDVERMAALPDQLLKWSAHGTDAARFAAVPRFAAFTVEEVVVHQPDLVVCGAFNLPETTAKLRALGVPLVVMPPADDLDGIVASLRLLGRLFGTDERAEAVCADLTRRAAALTADRRRAPLRVLAYANAGGGAFTSGRGTLVDAAIGLAGMRNAAVELGFTGDHPITVEEVLHLDPDVLLVGVDTGSEQDTSAAMLRTTPGLAELRAVRQQRIVSLHRSYASSASQELVTAAERLAAAVDAFASERGR